MPNINLATKKIPHDNSRIISSSLIITIIILILILCLYGALLFINKKISAQIKSTHSQYETEYNKFLTGNANNIIDFENRSEVAQKLISEDKPISNMLSQIETTILPPVYLDSYKYNRDKGIITLSCIGDNFNTVAKQILSFKKSGYFTQVIPGQSYINTQNNQLNFSINLKIK